jgi:hypothetical protein
MTAKVCLQNKLALFQIVSPRTKETLKTIAFALANLAIIGSLIALTIAFPQTMVPVWIGMGALLAFHGLVFLIFRHYALKS